MHASLLSSPLTLTLAALSITTAACSSAVIGGGGDGGGGTTITITGTTTATSSGSTSTTTTSGGTSTGTTTPTGPIGACSDPSVIGVAPTACKPTAPECGANGSRCLALHNAHAAPQFGLRVAQITLEAPQALKQGIVKNVFDSSTIPQQHTCNLTGNGGFNWLLQFDMTNGTLTTGGAKPTTNPSAGYSFVNETLSLGGSTFPIAPVQLSAPIDGACDVESSAGDVWLPFFDGTTSSTFTLFPLRSLRFTNTRVTPDHDCIGTYNAVGLAPSNDCMPDDQHPSFLDGGSFAAFIVLEVADTVQVPVLNESLCVLLSADASTYGQNGVCKRDGNNQIAFKGDWCSATNGPATPGCADALRFAGTFAASGVVIQ